MIKTTIFIGGFIASIGFATSGLRATPYNVNDAFVANETGGTPVDPNGSYTYGYTLDPTTGISTTGLVHSGMTGFNGTGAGVQGYYYPNNVSVPAILGNITSSDIATNFGATIQGKQLLLHPGSPTSDGYASPSADADVEYVIPSTGLYTISGSFEALSSGDAGISVYVNGVEKFSGPNANSSNVGTGYAGSSGTVSPFSITQLLAAGSTVQFIVSAGSNGIGSNSTGLFANVQTPEPASAAMLGLAAMSLLARRRRSE